MGRGTWDAGRGMWDVVGMRLVGDVDYCSVDGWSALLEVGEGREEEEWG